MKKVSVTDRYTYDGKEMSERERIDRLERNIERHAYFLIGAGCGALILFIAYIIDNLNH